MKDVDGAVWDKRELVRAWCMRRTMFLVPSADLAMFVRGSAQRAKYALESEYSESGSSRPLDRLLDDVLEVLRLPRTRTQIAEELRGSTRYRVRMKAGGGWGSRRAVPWVGRGSLSLPVGYLLHLLGAREVICSGPNSGTESTYVRADRWVPRWKDITQEEAEDELLTRYLAAFGPATLADYALWMGVYQREAKVVWARNARSISEVEVEGKMKSVLDSDLSELEKVEVYRPLVRLLPYFDSFLLGHRSHRDVVGEANHGAVYRGQGWVSPVVLVDGRAAGVWSQARAKDGLRVSVSPFSKLSSAVMSRVREEASGLGLFLQSPSVKFAVL